MRDAPRDAHTVKLPFILALASDALMFAALAWFAGYGALGPATGLRLSFAQKMKLFAEVLAITFFVLLLFIGVDSLLGWDRQPPWPGQPAPHRLVAIGALLTVGFLYTRRRSRAMDAARRRDGGGDGGGRAAGGADGRADDDHGGGG